MTLMDHILGVKTILQEISDHLEHGYINKKIYILSTRLLVFPID